MRRLATFAALLLIGAVGCGSDSPAEEDVLVSVTDLVITPAYEEVAADMSELGAALKTLCATPSQSALEGARSDWRDARASWMRSEATWFGPVEDRRSAALMDWSPVEPERIERMLAERPVSSETEVRDTLSSAQRGLGAVEYLLFGSDAFAGSAVSSSSRCAYLVAVGASLSGEASAILSDWIEKREFGPAYAGFFTGRADSSLVTRQAVAQLVRTQVFLVRKIVDLRLAEALGLKGDPDLTAIPGGPADNGLDDLRNEVIGLRDVYLGHDSRDGLGLSDMVAPLSEEADGEMRHHFEDVLSAIDAVEGPLKVVLRDRPERVQAVYDRLSELQVILNTEVVSLLSVAVGFSDTDGDSMK